MEYIILACDIKTFREFVTDLLIVIRQQPKLKEGNQNSKGVPFISERVTLEKLKAPTV